MEEKDSNVVPSGLRSDHVEELTIHEATDLEKAFVDEYFNNGFVKIKAACTVRPDKSRETNERWATEVMQRNRVQAYKKKKHLVLMEETNITTVAILNELLAFAYSDITDYIGLSVTEIKELPPQIRRCIESIDVTTKSYRNPVTKQIEREETTKIKLVSKRDAINMISKHIDFFNADNRSKGNTIDLSKASNDQLNAVLSLINEQKKLN